MCGVIARVLLCFLLSFGMAAHAAIQIVAAENIYGELAKEIGGKWVQVTNILNNPNQDPHLFSATPSVARQLADADIIVYNGAGYDTWMDKLLEGSQDKGQQVINIAEVIGAKPGVNPHLWYQPNTIPAYAKVLAGTLSKLDPNNQAYYRQQLAKLQQNCGQLTSKIDALRQKYAGTPVIATEPVYNYMTDALGFKMLGQGLQQSVMNDVEPTPAQLKEVVSLLTSHSVKVMFYNKQVVNPLTERLQELAKQHNISIVGITETQPTDKDYLGWMLEQLNDLEQALKYVANTAN